MKIPNLKNSFLFCILFALSLSTIDIVYAEKELDKKLIQSFKDKNSSLIKPEFERAFTLQEENKYKDASNIYKNVLKENINNALAWNNLGLCQQNMKVYDLAEKCYQKAMQIDPMDVQFYNNLASLQMETGDFKKAHENLLIAIQKDANYSFTYSNLANLYQQEGKIFQAVEYYKKAIDKTPLAEFYYRLGLLYYQMKKFDDMQETFLKGLSLQPNYPEIYYSLSLACLYNVVGNSREKRIQQLSIYLNKLTELNPKMAQDFKEKYLTKNATKANSKKLKSR